MEPSTPPRNSRHRDIPPTPATPRFGTFGDLPDVPSQEVFPQKHHHAAQQTPSRQVAKNPPTPSSHRRRKRATNILATPRQTPKRRKGRAPVVDEESKEIDDLMEEFNRNTKEAQAESMTEGQKAQITASHHELRHPHQPQPPPDVPGMWYVFRGKKVFRPFPPGVTKPEPVTLFKDILQRDEATAGGDTGSDAETDLDV